MLENLDVSWNFLEGIISELHLFNLTRLKSLRLSFTNLRVDLRSSWVPPFQLDTIDLLACNLGPRFPEWIKTQTNFSSLDISYSGSADTIPNWFWNHSTTSLKLFYASANAITGVLPDLSLKFSEYPGIDLSFNMLEGPIPLFPSTLTSLNLSGNKFSGGLAFIFFIFDRTLNFLDLSQNQLCGGIPDHCFNNLSELVILDLSHNNFSGKIPSSLGALSRITTLDLENNSFSGELPRSLINCTGLAFLNMGENKLSGIIPSWLGESLRNLYILIMRSNQFTGRIPSHICFLSKLQFLDLSANNLSGHIPQCFNNLTAMVQKSNPGEINSHEYVSAHISLDSDGSGQVAMNYFNDTAVVQWKGGNFVFSKNLGQLKSIDLSKNELTGELPEVITDLVEMVALNISRNKLNGVLPQEIGKLVLLESMDLSRNKFTGAIPPSMSALHFLSYLDLAYNNFSGRIPLGTQLQSFNASQYSGNEELCGPPLTPKCPGDPVETQAPVSSTVAGSSKSDEDELHKWFYIGSAAGFSTSFWVVTGTLLLYRPWRHAYFLYCSIAHGDMPTFVCCVKSRTGFI